MDDAKLTELIVRIAGVPFVVAWLVGVGAMLLGLAERMAAYILRGFFFGLGPIAAHRELASSTPPDPSLLRCTKFGRFHLRFTGPTRAIFATHYEFSRLRPRKLLRPVKGVVSWSGSNAEIVVRHPLGPMVFNFAWLVGWAIVSIALFAAGVFAGGPNELIWLAPLMFLHGIGSYAMHSYLLRQASKAAAAAIDEVVPFLCRSHASPSAEPRLL